jgi:PAS domain S-box-containing protein
MIKARHNPQSFSAQLVLGLVGLVLVTTLSAGVPAYWLTRTQLERQARAQVASIQQATLSLLQAERNRLINLAQLFAERPTLQRLVIEETLDELPAYVAAFQAQSTVDLVIFCREDGTVWAGDHTFEHCPLPGVSGFAQLGDQVVLLASVAVKAQESGAPLGVAVAGHWLDQAFLTQLAADTGAEQSVLSATGERIATTLPEGAGTFAPAPAQSITPRRIDVGRTPYFAVWSPLVGSDGAVHLQSEVALPVADLIATENQAMGILIASTGLVAVAGVLVATWYIRRLTRPLAQLTSIAREIARGNFIATMPSFSGPLEVATLASAFQRSHASMRQALGELAQARDWLNNLIQSIVEGVILFDGVGRITFLSQGAEVLTGWSSAEAVGQPVERLFQLSDPSDGNFRLAAPLPGQKRRLEVIARNGEAMTLAVTSARLAPVNGHQPQMALVLRDVTEEEAGRHLRSYFLSSITHEFRTPLSTLRASLELLLDETEALSAAEMRQLLKPTYLSLLSLQTLIDNLLESSRIESGRFTLRREPLTLDTVLAEATRIVQPLLERRRNTLVVQGVDALPLILGDTAQLTQVLVNLLTNAAKYSPMGEAIEVSAETVGDRLRIAVLDRGPGIPEGERRQLFRRFVRLDNQDGEQYGSGLGLYVVKTIIEAHGGDVGVESRPEGGSVFWFELPLQSEPDELEMQR